MTSFSIVILNWNGLTHLQECLQSVYETDYESKEIILVDNGSTDNSLEWVKEHFSDISVVELAGLLGYQNASAFSRAFKQKTGLSPDHWRAR